MKNKLVWMILIVSIVIGCKSDEIVPVDTQVKRFVWSAMNLFYYWQADVPELDDDNGGGIASTQLLERYNTPEELFGDLLISADRFSWIVDDYDELEQSFQGVSKSYGFNLGLVRITQGSDDLLAYIRYVTPNGPAESAGLLRGDLFTEVNGEKLTVSNYISLLFESENISITLSEINDNSIISTDRSIPLTAVQITENPILLSDILEVDGVKVGYMVYNQFVNNNTYHEEMNDFFGTFKSEGINDLVLDLRYNGGGSLLTSRILSSMIYGAATPNNVLGSIIYNEKLTRFNADLNFLNEIPVLNNSGTQVSTIPMNRLNINRVFVLTSGSSASASEFVIAGLLPYMDVTIIGETTVGKNVASVTIYDSEDFEKSATLNPNHKYAIQPIISQLANSRGFTDYIDGLEPNVQVREADFLGEIKPLGDPTEALLSEALAIITGVARTSYKTNNGMENLKDVRLQRPTSTILIEDKQLIRSLADQF